jgi:hypothetical protein
LSYRGDLMDRFRPHLSHQRLAGSDMAHGVARL